MNRKLVRANSTRVSIKSAVKLALRRASTWWYSTFRSFTPSMLTAALRTLGVREGDIVLAHVAYNEFLGFTGGPSDVMQSLRAAIGEAGTMLMPSMPFTGTAFAYVQSAETFDVQRTPSHMGLVTELFRRSRGTLRSLHPTHPVLANGPQAEALLSEHDRAATPCGQYSPFAKLLEHGGKIVLLGTGIGAMTFYHYLEELLADRLPRSPFTAEIYTVAFRGRRGEPLEVRTRLFDPEMSRRRDLSILERHLRERGSWREGHAGRVSIVVLEPSAVRDTALAMASNGIYCYA